MNEKQSLEANRLIKKTIMFLQENINQSDLDDKVNGSINVLCGVLFNLACNCLTPEEHKEFGTTIKKWLDHNFNHKHEMAITVMKEIKD